MIDRKQGGATETILADLSDLDSATRAGQQAVADGRPLDALVLCAGVNIPTMFAEQDIESWAKVIAVNLLGNAAVARATLESLTRKPGRLVGIGSIVSRRITPDASARLAFRVLRRRIAAR